ncbi:hypothetical protein F1559_002577 [Cyanidiococcus yangmingshanensis]|uniref:MoaB/Mog domain-containing protein n=1 Tax=Cyanidiococcus yangmingshanensis TaxID=2690220 RepID=A0A7J7ID49_9RHOD|nr:hypothetical protein F1559_002577 [Cyanidiococcus yangmingshanensis]
MQDRLQGRSPYPMVDMNTAWTLVEEVARTIAARWQCSETHYVDWDHEAVQSGTAVLAEDVAAPWPMPRFDAALKDGYAVRSADLASDTTLCCTALQVAGQETWPLSVVMEPGTCVYVTTGAPLPPGADAVVPVEYVQIISSASSSKQGALGPVPNRTEPFYIRLEGLTSIPAGYEVRRRGLDVPAGQVVLRRGQRLGPVERSVLCSFGIQERIPIGRLPRVAVLSTGSELVEACTPSSSVSSSAVYDSNRPLLRALLQRYVPASHILDAGIAADHQVSGKLKALLGDPLIDVLIISGGVSMGLSDVVKPLLADLGQIRFGRLLMKPGKPMTFASQAVDDDRPWMAFALPGNPVSSSVCFALLVAPAIQLVSGVPRERAYPRRLVVRLAEDAYPDAERPEFQRARLIEPLTMTESNTTAPVQATAGKRTAAAAAVAGLDTWPDAVNALAYFPLASTDWWPVEYTPTEHG